MKAKYRKKWINKKIEVTRKDLIIIFIQSLIPFTGQVLLTMKIIKLLKIDKRKFEKIITRKEK